jgi:tetratricopeptide (TPR) repeat protein
MAIAAETSPVHRAWLAVLVAVCLTSAIALQVARDARYPNVASPVDELYFTSGDSIGRMSLSFKPLLADLYWIRAVQYFGGTRIAAEQARYPGREAPASHYDLLYPLLDVTTTLDPQFNIAYRFGSIFLAEGYPNGPGQPELAIKLLDKGFAANPTKWQYVYDKAFVYYWSVKDYQQSAHWFSEAARIKGSPSWMPGLAAFMLGQGGDRRSSRFLWQQIHDTAEQQYMRDNATFHLTQLDLADLADRLSALLDRYRAQTGLHPMDFEPLVRAGWLRAVPTDVEGVGFVIDPQTGRATLRRPSRYAPLPEEPQSAAGAVAR